MDFRPSRIETVVLEPTFQEKVEFIGLIKERLLAVQVI